ncbi:DUF6152 family protein [Rhizobium sp. TH2]|uniref:DUF6152 family protein n=1 Tax=Rhizobium sp. TH2 TaxID=2775403 RepID=UPI002158491D|nr:DUF6152 family protein [Rhizobium sp. TH2]
MQHHARTLISAGIVAAFMATAALAHHGWSWAEADQIELTGTVNKVVIAPPHPTIDLTAADGVDWHIELGNPGNTARSGFNEQSAKPGDTITVLGNRSQDPEEKRLKAVRVTVGEKVYDIYPDRINKS